MTDAELQEAIHQAVLNSRIAHFAIVPMIQRHIETLIAIQAERARAKPQDEAKSVPSPGEKPWTFEEHEKKVNEAVAALRAIGWNAHRTGYGFISIPPDATGC